MSTLLFFFQKHSLVNHEIRKHHVLPGVNVLDLIMDVDGEKIMVQTQHQDGDDAFVKFARDALKLGKDLSKENTFLGRPKTHG